ncbi:unnamed protein product [Linum tenue]|uniref:Uncharacterized protein n=2 Tax=Linum tenue TaxID=586396 RepID=A0AAV0J4F1_9ROSI|nr:unnamed protein product [Linum tenue]
MLCFPFEIPKFGTLEISLKPKFKPFGSLSTLPRPLHRKGRRPRRHRSGLWRCPPHSVEGPDDSSFGVKPILSAAVGWQRNKRMLVSIKLLWNCSGWKLDLPPMWKDLRKGSDLVDGKARLCIHHLLHHHQQVAQDFQPKKNAQTGSKVYGRDCSPMECSFDSTAQCSAFCPLFDWRSETTEGCKLMTKGDLCCFKGI